MRPFLVCSLLMVPALTGACTEPAAPPTTGKRVRIVETYGTGPGRSVTLTALLSPGEDGVVEVSDVSLDVSPNTELLVRKLETLLEDVAFHWRAGQAEWPELARTVPTEAIPMIRHLQLALLLGEGPPNFEIDYPMAALSSPYPSLGLTRIARRDGNVAMASLALALHSDSSTFAWGHARGTRKHGVYTLTGGRQLGQNNREAISIVISHHAHGTGAPAGR